MNRGSGSERRRWAIGGVLLLLGLATAPPLPLAWADDAPRRPSKRIVGWVERVTMLPSRVPVYAKLDTGAKTSSIHAEEIERFEKDGDEWVRFTLVLEDPDDVVHRERLERPLFRDVRIKDHDDHADRRPVVELEFCLDGRSARAQFSLADRSSFLYPVLLGRRFLKGRFVIDPAETFEASKDCPKKRSDRNAAVGTGEAERSAAQTDAFGCLAPARVEGVQS